MITHRENQRVRHKNNGVIISAGTILKVKSATARTEFKGGVGNAAVLVLAAIFERAANFTRPTNFMLYFFLRGTKTATVS